MQLLEILNAYPGETFLREHAKAIIAHTDIQLSWAYTHTKHPGLARPPLEGLQHCFALPNFNRMQPLRKAGFRLQYTLLPWEKAKKRAVLRAIEKVQPDYIHFQFAGTAIQWAWVAEELQTPFSFSIRGSDVQVAPFTVTGYLSNLKDTGAKAARVHAVCDALKNQFCDLTDTRPDKVHVIRTAINKDWSIIERRPEKGFLLSVGRLHWRKGYSDLLLAAQQLKQEGVAFQLSILGEGPERPHLEYMIRDLGLSAQVQLQGNKSHAEIRKYMAAAHVYVQPSIAEGFPNAVAEAMLAGVPVVVSNCGGVPEIIVEAENGYLHPIGDSRRLAMQIRAALAADTTDMTANAQATAQQCFDLYKHAHTFSDFWKAAS